MVPANQPARFDATLRVQDRAGKDLPGFTLTRAEPEAWHGHRFLHVQADGPQETIEKQDVRAILSIRWEPATGR